MTWINERLIQRQALRERSALVREHAIPIYEALWQKIVERVDEARRESFPLVTMGSLQDRRVVLAPAGCARGSHGLKLEFVLDVCPDGVVCLKFHGERIGEDEAAIEILDAFLFPELPRREHPSSPR
jgi:hypothetical protein